jgi:hypothetical protein
MESRRVKMNKIPSNIKKIIHVPVDFKDPFYAPIVYDIFDYPDNSFEHDEIYLDNFDEHIIRYGYGIKSQTLVIADR